MRAKRSEEVLEARWRLLAGCASTRVIRDLPPPEEAPVFALYPPEPEARGQWLYNQLKDDRAVLCGSRSGTAPEAARGR